MNVSPPGFLFLIYQSVHEFLCCSVFHGDMISFYFTVLNLSQVLFVCLFEYCMLFVRIPRM